MTPLHHLSVRALRDSCLGIAFWDTFAIFVRTCEEYEHVLARRVCEYGVVHLSMCVYIAPPCHRALQLLDVLVAAVDTLMFECV